MRGVCLLVACGLAGCGFEHGAVPPDAPPDAMPTTATLFVADYSAGQLHRLTVARGADPVITLSLPLPGALSPVMLPATGELLVGELSNPRIDRFSTPLATPTFEGAITGVGLAASMSKMAVVDGELWVTNPSGANIDRLAFDASSTPSMVDTVGLVNGRGFVYRPATRDAYATQCCGTNVIQHYVIGADHSVTTNEPVSDNGLSNPHGLAVLPWGELLVANAGDNTLLRFALDAGGSLTAAGVISGNGLSVPIDLALTPWGELYVTNLTTGMSRFSFDDAHDAIAGGTFTIPGASTLGWTALVP